VTPRPTPSTAGEGNDTPGDLSGPTSPSASAATPRPSGAVRGAGSSTDPEKPPNDVTDAIPEQLRVRREKRQRLLDSGIEPYPVGVERTTSLAALRSAYPDLPPDTDTGQVAGVTGRVIFLRNSGKLCFATLREGGAGETGSELQVMVSLNGVGAESLAAFKADVDLGDHLFVHGSVITSRRGELSVLADSWAITAKALRPLPVAHKPLSSPI